MNPIPIACPEPVSAPGDGRGSPTPALDGLGQVLDLARQWAGADRLALIVSGSHAAGDAVWVTHRGRRVSISDLDVYAVVRDPDAKRAAIERARAARGGLGERLESMGLAAPLEVGFHTPANLAALPARPGTLELRRRGRVVEGDPSWLASVPAWTARDVTLEEVWLLLENRAFELLWAGHPASAGAPLMNLKRRHAVLKCALDLASVSALAAHEYPESAAARVAWARLRWDRSLEPPWDAALDWRSGHAVAMEPAAAEAERLRTVCAWVALWRRLAADPGDPARPFGSVARIARRARLRRRLRDALLPGEQVAQLALPHGRVRHALAGTPRHRLHGAAAATLILEATRTTSPARGAGDTEALQREYQRVLRGLGVPAEGADPGPALVRAWDRGFLDGQRTEGWV